jgi:type 1 glutamine amidotransferase
MKTSNLERTVTRRTLLGGAAVIAGLAAAKRLIAQPSIVTDPEELKRIEAALPAKAPAVPRKPRRLLIFDLNVGYGGHGSITTANTAFTLMGKKTGAFETVVSRDPAVFKPESLRTFDAVFFNNTVGNCFEDPALRQSLVEFIYAGGGLMGVHGTSVAFTKWPGAIEDWPEFGIMIGGRGANHKANDEHVFIKLDDPTHPVNQVFGGRGFAYRDEFFRVHEPYSRDRVRVLLSIDTARTDMTQQPSYGGVVRADNDYALAWVRQYGLGRVFYCGFAHHPSVFWDPKMLEFYLAATQFALGDLPAPTTPSAKLTPAIRAQEQLGWQVALIPPSTTTLTLFETIDKAAEMGLLYIGAWSHQTVDRETPKRFDDGLGSEDLMRIRLKLDAAGVRLVAYRTDPAPADAAARRKSAEFARRMGVAVSVVDGELLRDDPPIVEDTALKEKTLSSLDRVFRRGPGNPVVIDFGHTDSMSEMMKHVERLNNMAIKMVNGGGS